MNLAFANHMQRIRAGVSQAVALDELSRWIAENTYINNKLYSYEGHEYQKFILDSTAQEDVVRKCSQMGVTELAIRKAVAMCGMIKNFTTIYTLPTASFAAMISKTRVSTVIRESPYLSDLVDETDNVEVKQFKNGSYLHLKGSASGNAPISTPCDQLIQDELSFSDPLIISQYQSRLTHSPWKKKFKLSTPTLPGKGIDLEFTNSNRYFNFCRCQHCNHHFIPDYFRDVKIPGFSGQLESITRPMLHTLRYKEAFVACPKCGKQPDLSPIYREWVCENPDENHIARGVQVSPFDAPKIITPGFLVESSTVYTSISEFVNFNLGLPFFSKEAVLAPEEVQALFTNEIYVGGTHVIGIDLGKTCNVVVASVRYDGSMQVVHREKVPLMQLRDRYKELRLKYRVRVSVIDSLPYTDTVMSLQAMDKNLYASVYVQTKGTELFTTKKMDEDEDKGKAQMRQINVSRDRTFDALMEFFRSGSFSVLRQSGEEDLEYIKHCTDMQRVKDWDDKAQEIRFRWVKSDSGAGGGGQDHYWFATSYAYLASKIIGAADFSGGGRLPMVSKFKVKPS